MVKSVKSMFHSMSFNQHILSKRHRQEKQRCDSSLTSSSTEETTTSRSTSSATCQSPPCPRSPQLDFTATEETTTRVTFDDQVFVSFTLSRHDISLEERRATWYSEEELGNVSNSSRTQFNRLDHGKQKKVKRGLIRALEPKSVSFNEQVFVGCTISLHDISNEERKAAWYAEEELAQILQSCRKQIKKLDRGKCLKDVKYCARGLESDTRQASLAKEMNRSLAYQLVFEEQYLQRRQGVLDEEFLAHLYHSASSSCQLWANAMGLADQRIVQATLDDNDDSDEQEPARPSRINNQLNIEASNTSPPSPRRIRNIPMARAA